MIATLYRRLAELCCDQTGTPAIEFAAVLPLLGMFVFGVLQFGMAFQAYAGVRNAVEVGARYATIYPYPTDDAIRNKVTANAFGVNTSLLGTPTVTHGTATGSAYVDVTLTYPISMSLGFISTPTYTITYTRRAYQQ